MTAPAKTRIRLSDPAQLIAAVPHLIGFVPHDSLIVVTLDGKRLGLTLRADLVAPADAELLAEQLLGPVARQQPSAAMLLIIGGEPDSAGELPHRVLVDTVDDALATEGIPVVHAAWAAGTAPGLPWSCYDEVGCAGTVPDSTGSTVAAATVAAGTVTFDSREQLAGLLDPDPAEVLARRARLLDLADEEHPMSPRLAASRLAQLEALHDAARADRLTLDDRTAVEAASGLCDHRIRDACLAWSDGHTSPAAEQLWLALTRATPAPQRAEPATLLGFTAYLRGDGALAGIALDAALDASPGHTLASLLRRALDGGLRPATMRTLATDSAVDARLGLGLSGER